MESINPYAARLIGAKIVPVEPLIILNSYQILRLLEVNNPYGFKQRVTKPNDLGFVSIKDLSKILLKEYDLIDIKLPLDRLQEAINLINVFYGRIYLKEEEEFSAYLWHLLTSNGKQTLLKLHSPEQRSICNDPDINPYYGLCRGGVQVRIHPSITEKQLVIDIGLALADTTTVAIDPSSERGPQVVSFQNLLQLELGKPKDFSSSCSEFSESESSAGPSIMGKKIVIGSAKYSIDERPVGVWLPSDGNFNANIKGTVLRTVVKRLDYPIDATSQTTMDRCGIPRGHNLSAELVANFLQSKASFKQLNERYPFVFSTKGIRAGWVPTGPPATPFPGTGKDPTFKYAVAGGCIELHGDAGQAYYGNFDLSKLLDTNWKTNNRKALCAGRAICSANMQPYDYDAAI